MLLLCANARTYNLEGSVIYSDSQELETGFLAARAHIESGGVDFGDSDEEPFPDEVGLYCLYCIHIMLSFTTCSLSLLFSIQ